MAKNLEDGNCKACYVPDTERRVHREVARTYNTAVKEVTRAKNRIRKKFDYHNIDTSITAKMWNAGHYKYARNDDTTFPNQNRDVPPVLKKRF